MPDRVLVVDDDPGMALAMARVLGRHGFDVVRARNGVEALDALGRSSFAAVVTDLRMPGMDGHELAHRVRALAPALPVVVVTAFATVESAVSCVRDGAVDYLTKPFSPDALLQAVRKGISASPAARSEDDGVVAADPATVAALALAQRAAGTDATVLLEAESGAGKEVFAKVIHRESPRRDGPFVAVNCAALPRELLEAELFGHCKGAFTGALRDRRGHFQAADGGTLLLDEIGEMSTELQARLLRVLQERCVRPVGSESTIPVDVRVVAATNKRLRNEVAAGKFREDLYFRLHVFPIHIPPLRERPGDIEPLAARFARRFAGDDGRLTAEAVRRLLAHTWPGNVRELQNAVQRAAILSASPVLDAEHFDLEPGFRSTSGGTLGNRADDDPEPPLTLEDAERDAIRRILERTGGNRSEAAAALGISPRTLRHKLKQWRDAGRPLQVAAR